MYDLPEVKIEFVTPARAEALLRQNTRNRKLRENLVKRYAGAMTRGEWRTTGDGVKVAPDGRLLDGQHRLQAIVDSGVEGVHMVVATGVEDEAQEVIDTGSSRSFADMLKLRGESNSHLLATTLRMLWFYYSRGTMQVALPGPTPQQLFALLDERPRIRDSVRRAKNSSRSVGLPDSAGAACYHVFAETDEEEAEAFFTQLTKGVGLEEHDPITALRKALIRDGVRSAAKQRVVPLVKAAWTIKTFNYWRAGVPRTMIAWKPSIEPFPRVEGDA